MTTTAPASFKGWTIPGPTVPGLAASGAIAVGEGETLDALSGHFKIFQRKQGHRFSTDDVLTAWYGTSNCPRAERVLDLGSGIGSVGMTAAWRLPGARFVTVEAQAQSVALARRSCAYNGLEGRYEIREGDLRDSAWRREGEQFDLILGSPPYFPEGTGVMPSDPQSQACRFELRGSVADYLATARELLAPGGIFACVFPYATRDRLHEGARAHRMARLRERPVVFRAGEPPLLVLSISMRADDLPEAFRGEPWIEPPLTIRRADGSVDPEYSRIKLSFGFPPG